jgi:hypothetical protein
MFKYSSQWAGWTACLPIASDLIIDSTVVDPELSGRPEIQGAPVAFSKRVHDMYMENLNDWIRNGSQGNEPLDPSDTALAMRSFTFFVIRFDTMTNNEVVLLSIPEQMRYYEKHWDQKRASAEVPWREKAISVVKNRNGKEFIRTVLLSVDENPTKGWFTVAQLQVEHRYNDLAFIFQGVVASRDTTCNLECMERDSTMILFDRIVDSIDW